MEKIILPSSLRAKGGICHLPIQTYVFSSSVYMENISSQSSEILGAYRHEINTKLVEILLGIAGGIAKETMKWKNSMCSYVQFH